MANLFDELLSGHSSIVNGLHTEICRALAEGHRDLDPSLTKNEIIYVLSKALRDTKCGELPIYDLKNIPKHVKESGMSTNSPI